MLPHETYLGTKFEAARSNGLGADTFTRNVTEARTHRRTDGLTDRRTDRRTTDRLWYEINIPFFSKEKSGYNERTSMKFVIYTKNESNLIKNQRDKVTDSQTNR